MDTSKPKKNRNDQRKPKQRKEKKTSEFRGTATAFHRKGAKTRRTATAFWGDCNGHGQSNPQNSQMDADVQSVPTLGRYLRHLRHLWKAVAVVGARG